MLGDFVPGRASLGLVVIVSFEPLYALVYGFSIASRQRATVIPSRHFDSCRKIRIHSCCASRPIDVAPAVAQRLLVSESLLRLRPLLNGRYAVGTPTRSRN